VTTTDVYFDDYETTTASSTFLQETPKTFKNDDLRVEDVVIIAIDESDNDFEQHKYGKRLKRETSTPRPKRALVFRLVTIKCNFIS
jgi:hypothetical protein